MLAVVLPAALAEAMTLSRTITFQWSLTSTSVNGLGATSAVAVKSWQVRSVVRPIAIEELPELASVPIYSSVFIVVGVPLAIIFVIGGLYSSLCRKPQSVANPKFVDPAFFVGSAADPLARARARRGQAERRGDGEATNDGDGTAAADKAKEEEEQEESHLSPVEPD
jgi:hypothetical protein